MGTSNAETFHLIKIADILDTDMPDSDKLDSITNEIQKWYDKE